MTRSVISQLVLAIIVLFAAILVFANPAVSPLTVHSLLSGLTLGSFILFLCFAIGGLLKGFSLKIMNETTLGIASGVCFGYSVLLFLEGVVGTQLFLAPEVRLLVYSASAYFGTLLIARGSQELKVCIPFLQLESSTPKRREILLDPAALSDSRLVDLAHTGLLDHQLTMPRYAVRDLHTQSESSDEFQRCKAKRNLDTLRRLEALPNLGLRYIEADCPEIHDPWIKLLQLARTLQTRLLTTDLTRVQQSAIEGIQIINLHTLSQAMKPMMQTGESIQIKIQRYGKEPRQGVGYLEDGTMVVVNGGAEYIGDTIKASVLSIKHTSSGRMIFCNAIEEGLHHETGVSPDYKQHPTPSYP